MFACVFVRACVCVCVNERVKECLYVETHHPAWRFKYGNTINGRSFNLYPDMSKSWQSHCKTSDRAFAIHGRHTPSSLTCSLGEGSPTLKFYLLSLCPLCSVSNLGFLKQFLCVEKHVDSCFRKLLPWAPFFISLLKILFKCSCFFRSSVPGQRCSQQDSERQWGLPSGHGVSVGHVDTNSHHQCGWWRPSAR